MDAVPLTLQTPGGEQRPVKLYISLESHLWLMEALDEDPDDLWRSMYRRDDEGRVVGVHLGAFSKWLCAALLHEGFRDPREVARLVPEHRVTEAFRALVFARVRTSPVPEEGEAPAQAEDTEKKPTGPVIASAA